MLSRVADSLYWMAAISSAPSTPRALMAVKLESMIEQTPEDAARLLGAGGRGLDRRDDCDDLPRTPSPSPARWPSTATMNPR